MWEEKDMSACVVLLVIATFPSRRVGQVPFGIAIEHILLELLHNFIEGHTRILSTLFSF